DILVRVISSRSVDGIKCFIAYAIRESFPILGNGCAGALPITVGVVSDAFALHRLAVDIKLSILHLNVVARQANQALYIVGLIIGGQLEHDDIAALGLLGKKDPSFDRNRPKFETEAIN